MRQRPRVKICCIMSEEEASWAVAAGASAIGLVGAMPSGPGVIADEAIARIAAVVPRGVESFLLTSRTDPEGIAEHHRMAGTTTIQIVDRVTPATHQRLRSLVPGVRLVQVIHVAGAASVDEAVALAPSVDALLLDSGRPGAPVRELGGTGRTHDWSVSRAIQAAVNRPVYLAGGLHAGNVQEAIEAVGPYGLDLCSGVRSDGRLDRAKLTAFFAAVDEGASG
ncbi:MAG: phosphoribosylanthranilate isomerase [Gemmatimonadales bacterium]